MVNAGTVIISIAIIGLIISKLVNSNPDKRYNKPYVQEKLSDMAKKHKRQNEFFGIKNVSLACKILIIVGIILTVPILALILANSRKK